MDKNMSCNRNGRRYSIETLNQINKDSLKKLEEIKKAAIESCDELYDFSTYTGRRIYSQDVIKHFNKQLESNKGPIMVEQEDGTRVFLTEPRLVHTPEKDTDTIISFSIVGKEVPKEVIDILIANNHKFKEYKNVNVQRSSPYGRVEPQVD